MKSFRHCILSRLLPFLPVLLFLCFVAKPLRAEERSPKESIAEELKTKEAEPPGYGKYTDRLIFIADLDVFITLSDLVGSDAVWGGGVNALLAPTYKFNDKNFLILMYDGQLEVTLVYNVPLRLLANM